MKFSEADMRRCTTPGGGPYEFHVARDARERYEFDDALFSTRGHVIFANFHAARVFAQKMNDTRDLAQHPELAVSAGQINAMGLIDEVLHLIIQRYREQVNPQVMQQALAALDAQLGAEAVDRTLLNFAEQFPTVAVYRGDQTVEEYFRAATEGIPNREIVLEEMLMLWLGNANPAYQPFLELFDDQHLEQHTEYDQAIDGLQEFLQGEPGFGDSDDNLFLTLRAPALKMPHSLSAQLEFLLGRFGGVLGSYLFRLLTSLDLIKEEDKFFLHRGMAGGAGGTGPVEVGDFRGQEHEPERFTEDREWMPRLVLIAKNAFVWLDQLSKTYNRPITTLDQIPDEELDFLQRAGITGLWLIGLWERSKASKTIKQIMGNQDAVASAYSLFDYVIAGDLGGEPAVDRLRQRAWQRNIRLASDMVPNHVGIDGKWVIEHPEWFIQLPYPPYPSYTFNGPDLSWDERVGVFLEDHYYNHSDAAVVFKRVDRWNGDTRYIYHGNDGTTMPWNDTAQLDYLKAEVREAVIQTILHVARQFPIIRFDAAMTLAKRHVQRLWYPEPGSGSGIASRAEHGLTKAQFDALMPQEFWREVVDRCAVEAPDTLLLAEAFWLMESYFVRTLGMHRVYNSAFMHLLRDEDNAKYRTVMKNTLEFDPQILQRYVNFMNNPDEKTAVEQFGKDDKYFGIATLMATLPGLPMVGHGQLQGFAEKYGMEYRRAYWDEQPDHWLLQRHERQIYPLFHKRYLFSGADNFLLYDFFTPEGGVNEDVFAYSNRAGDERSLVLYHNRYADARGYVRTSVAYSVKDGDERKLVQRSLADGLGLHHDDQYFMLFRDHVSGLEYIRSSKQISEDGMYIELGAYQLHVFLDIREVRDNDWRQYAQLNSNLNGRGVPSLEEASREIFLQPIHAPFRELVNADLYRRLIEARAMPEPSAAETAPTAADVESTITVRANLDAALAEAEDKLRNLINGISEISGTSAEQADFVQQLRRELEALLDLPVLARSFLAGSATTASTTEQRPDSMAAESVRSVHNNAELIVPTASKATSSTGANGNGAADFMLAHLGDNPQTWGTLFTWVFTHRLARLTNPGADVQSSASLIDEWLLGRLIAQTQRQLGQDEGAAWRTVGLIKLLIAHDDWYSAAAQQPPAQFLATWLRDSDVQRQLQVNRHNGIMWFNKEALEQLLAWLVAIDAACLTTNTRAPDVRPAIRERVKTVQQLRQLAEEAGYQVDAVLAAAQPAPNLMPGPPRA